MFTSNLSLDSESATRITPKKKKLVHTNF